MKFFPTTLIFITLATSALFIARRSHSPADHAKKRIVCTTTFLADLLEQIAGDTVQITNLMQPGIDPHLYKATEQDMHSIANADLIIYHGLHLEGKMAELFKAMATYKPTFSACATLVDDELRATDNPHSYDPHIWFSVPLWIKVAGHLTNVLVQQIPEYTILYQQNAQAYCSELGKLHEYVLAQTQTLSPSQRILITAHDAFGYFGQTYGFTVIGLQGVSTDADISTANVEELAHYIATHNVSTIFTELSIPHKSIQALQQAVARHQKSVCIGPELYTDSLGDANTPAAHYTQLMRYTIDILVQALQAKKEDHARST